MQEKRMGVHSSSLSRPTKTPSHGKRIFFRHVVGSVYARG